MRRKNNQKKKKKDIHSNCIGCPYSSFFENMLTYIYIYAHIHNIYIVQNNK
jgi:hypothetical protein